MYTGNCLPGFRLWDNPQTITTLSNPFNSKLSFAGSSSIQLQLRVPSRIRKTRPPLRHYHNVVPRTRGMHSQPGSSALPHPASYTAAQRRTAPSPSNLCPSFLPTLITIHSSYGHADNTYSLNISFAIMDIDIKGTPGSETFVGHLTIWVSKFC